MSLQETEAASAAVAKSPDTRVKLADIEAAISSEVYISAMDAALASTLTEAVHFGRNFMADDAVVPAVLERDLKPLTLCIVTMRNGFTVIGKAAPADPANFNPELGRKFAREDAVRQLWPLMGYALRDRLMLADDVDGWGDRGGLTVDKINAARGL